MKKNNFFEGVVCFLAVWSGILLSIFLGFEIWKMAETFVANIQTAFTLATSGGVVLCAMIASIFVAVIYFLVNYKPKSKQKKAQSTKQITKAESKNKKEEQLT